MCIAIPGQVIEVDPERPEFARVSVEGAVRTISLALLDGDPPSPGDWVVVQLGFAMERMSETEAHAARRVLEALVGMTEDDLFEDLQALALAARAAPP